MNQQLFAKKRTWVLELKGESQGVPSLQKREKNKDNMRRGKLSQKKAPRTTEIKSKPVEKPGAVLRGNPRNLKNEGRRKDSDREKAQNGEA